MRKVALVLIVVCLLASSATGEDMFPPPWDPTLPNQTYQHWIFPLNPYEPFEQVNPYGEPYIEWPATAELVEVEDWTGITITTWHIGGEPGQLSEIRIWIPNNKEENLYKLLHWQMTTDGSPTPTGDPPVTDPPGTSLPTGNPRGALGGNWYVYDGLIRIVPNPEGEWLTFTMVTCAHIEEIVIRTVCVVPEPTTMGLTAAGGLLLAMWRRRRR
ncbi:MAG: PEP-CTERM sorting domain-containing protein [Planctomycetes bacterium]|nr:PEP-CTERM sorting domain-containing protein [Planctomycetota bacterium]